jgi:hypothetical protein
MKISTHSKKIGGSGSISDQFKIGRFLLLLFYPQTTLHETRIAGK